MGIYRALGNSRKDDVAFAALAKVYRGDPKDYPAASAAEALGATGHPDAFDILVRGMDRPSHAEVVADHAARGLAALRDTLGTALAQPGGTLEVCCETVTQALRQRGEDDITLVLARIRQ